MLRCMASNDITWHHMSHLGRVREREVEEHRAHERRHLASSRNLVEVPPETCNVM